MGFIQFIYDGQIFNPTDFTAYAVKTINNDNDEENILGVVDVELFVDDKYLDGSYSLKIYSKGINSPIFFSSALTNYKYYRFSYLSKRINTETNPIYFLI